MALVIQVKVVPSSGRNQYRLDKSGQLKIYLKSPPERGKANHELVSLLAKELRLPLSAIAIVSGHTDPKKRLKVETSLTFEQLLEKLGIHTQTTFITQKD